MTRDEAIEVLKAIIPKDSRGNGKVLNTLAITKAILMGIEALEQQPSKDYIDRKVAIDELKQQADNMYCWSGRYNEQRKGILIAINIVSDLSSVTPQPKFLIHADGKMEQINPQQKTGHWVLSGGYWRCSECKGKARLKFDKSKGGYNEYEQYRSKYCPECGARMEAKE